MNRTRNPGCCCRPGAGAIIFRKARCPRKLELVLADQIYIPKQDLSPSLRNALLHLAAFQNPEFYKAQAMRLSTYDKPRIIACAEDHAQHIGLPRGCLEEVLALLRGLKIDLRFARRAIQRRGD